MENEGRVNEEPIPSFKEPWGFTIDVEYKPTYWWRTEIPKDNLKNIEEYSKKYEKYLWNVHNTSNKAVWDIYDHMTEDIFDELFKETADSLDDQLDSYLDAIIKKEFGI